MPYYDYKSDKCGHEFEESLKIADRDAPTEQPCRFSTCGGEVKMVYAKPHIGDPCIIRVRRQMKGLKIV